MNPLIVDKLIGGEPGGIRNKLRKREKAREMYFQLFFSFIRSLFLKMHPQKTDVERGTSVSVTCTLVFVSGF